MAKNDMMLKIGTFAFLGGIVIALLFGFYQAYTLETADVEVFFTTESGGAVAWILAALGVIIGILAAMGKGTITAKETPGFLLASIALLVLGAVFQAWDKISLKPWIGSLFAGVSFSIAIFIAPVIGILAIKAIWDMGKDV